MNLDMNTRPIRQSENLLTWTLQNYCSRKAYACLYALLHDSLS